jgi:CHAT domain-containing protein/predicted negative regulator of RcsB-dependent stress response
MLVFFWGAIVFAQDKSGNADKDRQLREEILAVYKSKGEQGLLDFFRKKKDKISNKFIVDFADAGLKERKEEWLRVCEIIAEEKGDEKTLADVLYQTGEYFRLTSDNKKAGDYYERAFSIYENINDVVGQGNVYLTKGRVYNIIGEYSKALEMFDKAQPFFEKAEDFSGQGNVYFEKGVIYFNTGKTSRAIEFYDKALASFKKINNSVGEGNVYKVKGDIYLYSSDYSKAMELYDKALLLFNKAKHFLGLGNVYRRKGEIYYYTGNYSGALGMYDKALSFYEKIGYIIGQGNVYWNKGNIYLHTKESRYAMESYDKALSLFKKANDPLGQGNVYKKKGDIYFGTGDNARALEMYNKALIFFEKVGDPLSIGNANRSKGYIYFLKYDYSKAMELYDKALYSLNIVNDFIGLGNVYLFKGELFMRTGDNLEAFKMLSRALDFFKKAKEPIGQAHVYKFKGEIYFRFGDFSKANEIFDKALPLFFILGQLNGIANTLHRKGDFYYVEGNYSKAKESYKKSLDLYKKLENPVGQGNVYLSMGNVYLKEDNNKEAMEMYDKALNFYENIEEFGSQANVYVSKGYLYFKNRDYPGAIDKYNKALALFEKIGEIESFAFTLHRKAKCFIKQKKKPEALTLLENATSLLEKVRSQSPVSEIKMTFMEFAYEDYEETVLFMLENKYYDKGFKYAEAMRTRVFLDQMSEGLVPLEKGLKPRLKEKRDKLVGKLSFLSKEIHKTEVKEKKKLEQLKREHGKVENEFEELLIKIRLENPLYASVRYPQPVAVRELQKKVLKKGETLVQYFISPDKTYAFLVSKKRLKVVPLEVKEEQVESYVNRMLLAMKGNIEVDMKTYGRILYRELFKPVEAKLKGSRDIIIIPHSHLEKIPFESFVTGEDKSGQPVFLLEKYRIKYIQSASLLSILRKHYQRNRETNNFIGFGDPVYDYENFKQGQPEQGSMKTFATESIFSREDTRSDTKEKSLSSGPPVSSVAVEDEIKEIFRSRYARAGGLMNRLQGSGEEVKTIAELFRNKNQMSVVFLREEATEENARAANLKDFDFIHFACHGLLNDDFQSLVLSQLPPDKSQQDGYFTLNEIMNCDYNAKLVVLSGCKTGSGKMYKGEGVTGLTRAVMYAGTPAVIASLWKVDDTATKELMINFYRNMLEKDMGKVEALRQAKLEMIKEKKYASPLFWSAFVLYGE